MKFDIEKIDINGERAFFVFMAVVVAVIMIIGDIDIFTAIVTGLFFYLFVRACYFVWGIILRLIGGHYEKFK